MLNEMQILIGMLDAYFAEAQALLKDLSKEQLNWRPVQGETREEMSSSLYGLALHMAFVAMRGAANVGGRTLENYPEMREGNNGITALAESAERATQLLDNARTLVREVAEELTAEQLEELRERRFGNRVAEPQTVHWLMWHILEHTALHVGHMELTRQLVLLEA